MTHFRSHAFSALWIGLAASLVALPEHAAPSDAVAVSVGSSTLTVGDVARRIAAVPPFQLATYGKTPDEIRHHFVERVLVPELLHAEEARRQKLDAKPGVADRARELARQALEAELREGVETKEPVTPAEVAHYFSENRSRFETPPRIRLWRILLADEAQAKRTLELARGQEGPARWTEAARQTSLDKATAMRGGDLGFVRADGTTDVPRVRVEPALYAAAEKVKDGEVLAEPVREGNQWAAVWRRGSLPEIKRTIEQEERSIRQVLARKKLEDRRLALLDQLRKQHVRDVNETLLESLEIKTFGELGTPGRPGVVPRHHAPAAPAPSAGPRGLR
jgi:peptidyl-prolyl cis-trans isomerase C